ncbi:hypothetical protein C2W64_01511 [Brevibacillus laterosporus]|nr:peptide ABC transporter substrate-binding protein [Brevibacillus laterosporus]RAP26555.1 hypothetical protein C2W64_01511 [Brevibacillus laterosporus]
MKKLLLPALAILLFLVPTLTACGNQEGTAGIPESGASAKQELTANLAGEPYSLDPAIATDTKSFWIIDHLYEGLYAFDKEGNVVEGAAQKVEISPDGKTYTFTIRDDAKWSNGDAVTAKDYEYSWKRVLNKETGATNAFYLYYIKGAEAYNKGEGKVENVKVNATDDKTLVVELNAPTSYFPKVMMNNVYFPVNQKVVEGNKNWVAEANTLVSNGAYKLASWEHDSQLKLTKSENYWNKSKISMDTLNFKMVPDATTYYQMYKTGELDIIDTLPIDAIDQEKNNKEYVSLPKFGTYLYTFNVTQEPFTNAKIRRAFALSVDRDLLTQNVTKAGETPAYAYVPQGVKTGDADFRGEKPTYFTFDPTEAKKLLAEGMKEEGWSKLPTVTLKYNNAQNHKKVAEALQQMFTNNLGVDVKLENQEWKTYIDTYKQSNFQMARMGWVGSFLDPVAMLDYYLGESPNNQAKWVNPKFDTLMEKAKVEQDEAQRNQYLHEAEDIFMQDLPVLPIFFYSQNYLNANSLTDVTYSVYKNPDLRWAKKVAE